MSSIIQNTLFLGKLGELALTCDCNKAVTSDLTSAFNFLTILEIFFQKICPPFKICSLTTGNANLKKKKTNNETYKNPKRPHLVAFIQKGCSKTILSPESDL